MKIERLVETLKEKERLTKETHQFLIHHSAIKAVPFMKEMDRDGKAYKGAAILDIEIYMDKENYFSRGGYYSFEDIEYMGVTNLEAGVSFQTTDGEGIHIGLEKGEFEFLVESFPINHLVIIAPEYENMDYTGELVKKGKIICSEKDIPLPVVIDTKKL